MKLLRSSIRTIMLSIIFVVCGSGINQNCMADDIGMVNIEDYSAYVVDLGGANEDWQPAFQQALTACFSSGSTLFIPCGTYKIRQTIIVPGIASSGVFNAPGRLTIKGAGQFQSVISQQDNTKNVMDWTASTYEGSYAGGTLRDLSLIGGKTCLNIKWHNQFRMYNCYIGSAEDYGIYAEGWSNRFFSSTIRKCLEAGIYGGAHFNDIVIRDGYFSRNGIGIRINGGRGIRISGCGMEKNVNCAIAARGAMNFTINNSYFEGNGGYEQAGVEIDIGLPSTIHLDYACSSVQIINNIFRETPRALSLSYCVSGKITDNTFYNYDPTAGSKGIELRDQCETNTTEGYVTRTIIKDNYFENFEQWLSEETPGVIDGALSRDCLFQKQPGANIVSSEQLGPELVVDGDMELTGVANWGNQYTPAVKAKSSLYAHSGDQSLHIVSDSGGDGVHQIFQPLNPLGAGKLYRVSLWIKNSDTTEYLKIKMSGTDLNIPLETYDTEWKSFVFYTTFDSYDYSHYFCVAYGTDTSDVYVDDISIREVISTDLF